MHLRKLSIVNFKNYEQAEFSFSERINCFVGDNGVGKTNLMDAIHYLSLAKSYFNAVDSQNIRHEQDFAVIQGEFEREGKNEFIYCGIQRNKRKQFRRNKKDYQKLSEHIGLIPLVMISPSDSSLILEGGEERRKFINSVIAQFDRNYLENIIHYNHALLQRNKILKEFNSGTKYDPDYLQVWDEQLISYGQEIFRARKDFIEKLLPVFETFYKTISGEKEEVELIYESQLFEKDMRTLLNESLRKDMILQYTTSGIHKDDLEMKLAGYPLKKTGSQGQQKTFLVALKLAKFDFIKNISNLNPILLLDDIFDKFDLNRVEQIIRLVAENTFGQIFISDTNFTHLKKILKEINIDHKVFLISDNQTIKETK
ncbi:MAG: DNA replication/repair protein RecF [Bacteroidales bacterium]|nr:DNA replication/repair protein RecF [Bacteroidales bacterium]